jgi:hypothetical protein
VSLLLLGNTGYDYWDEVGSDFDDVVDWRWGQTVTVVTARVDIDKPGSSVRGAMSLLLVCLLNAWATAGCVMVLSPQEQAHSDSLTAEYQDQIGRALGVFGARPGLASDSFLAQAVDIRMCDGPGVRYWHVYRVGSRTVVAVSRIEAIVGMVVVYSPLDSVREVVSSLSKMGFRLGRYAKLYPVLESRCMLAICSRPIFRNGRGDPFVFNCAVRTEPVRGLMPLLRGPDLVEWTLAVNSSHSANLVVYDSAAVNDLYLVTPDVPWWRDPFRAFWRFMRSIF